MTCLHVALILFINKQYFLDLHLTYSGFVGDFSYRLHPRRHSLCLLLVIACLSSFLTSQPRRGIETKVSVSSLPGSSCIRDCNGLLALSRSLSVSSVSSVSSASSSSSSVRSADSEDMYADLASPVSSASSRSPTPAQQKKGRGTWFGIFFSRGSWEKKRGTQICVWLAQ